MTVTTSFPNHALLEKCWWPESIDQKQSIDARQLCPCCSYVLLRHIRANQLYWRCGYCYQDMPVLEDNIRFST
jgi:hypothetical protein